MGSKQGDLVINNANDCKTLLSIEIWISPKQALQCFATQGKIIVPISQTRCPSSSERIHIFRKSE